MPRLTFRPARGRRESVCLAVAGGGGGPEVGAFGVVDRAEDAFLHKGDVLSDGLDELFHILAFGEVVGGAGVFDHGQSQAVHRARDVAFLDVDEWADEGHAALVHIRSRSEAGEAPLIKEGHERRLRHVVRVVTEGEFAAAQTVDLAVQCASAEFGAKRAGVGLLPRVKDYLRDVRFDDMAGDAERFAKPRDGVRLRDGGVFEAHVHRDGFEVEPLR